MSAKKSASSFASAAVLTTNWGTNCNLSAPGAFWFLDPKALSYNESSTRALIVFSAIRKPTDLSTGILL